MSGFDKKMNLSNEQREELLRTLKVRFEKNMNRHKGLEWADVQARLEASLSGQAGRYFKAVVSF